VLDAELVRDLLIGVEERVLSRLQGLDLRLLARRRLPLSYSISSAGQKRENPKLLYLCDPVMGDTGPGFYSNADIRAYLRSLVPWRISLRQTVWNWSISLDGRRQVLQVLKTWSRPPVGWGYRRLS